MKNRTFKTIVALFLMAILAFAFVGCEKDGPAEELGEKVDDAIDDAGDAMEDAADEVEDAIDEAGEGGS